VQVICPTFVENEDVMQIYDHKRIGESSQDIIHQDHEGCWSIIQSKIYDQPFEKTLFRLEGGLLDISLFNWDFVVSGFQINFAKELGSLELARRSSIRGIGY
jgi:hypothetical protein